VLVLFVLILVLTQTEFGKKQIVKYAQQIANKSLNAELQIAKLDGNIFSWLSLSNIVLLQNNDTIVHIDKLELSYQLIDLFDNRITFNQITLNNPTINLVQLADSSWNVEHIVKPDTLAQDTSSGSFDMLLTVHEFIISNGNVAIHSTDTVFPQQISSIDTRLTASYATNQQKINVSSFNCSITNPDFTIKNFRAQLTNNADQILVDLMLKTAQNKAYINGNYYFDNIQKSEINASTTALELSEFSHWIPKQFQLKIKPIAHITAKIENKKLKASLKIETPKQHAKLDLQSTQFVKKFIENLTVNSPDYQLQLELHKLDLRDWMNDRSMNYVLNGTINADATGNNVDDLSLKLQTKLNNTFVTGVPISRFESNLNYNEGTLAGKILLKGGFGTIYIQPKTTNSLQKNIAYTVDLTTENLNIAPFMGESYPTDINMKLGVKGRGYNPKNMQLKALLKMKPSKVLSFEIDTVFANIDYIKQNIDLKNFFIKTLSSDLSISGNFHQRDTSNMQALLNVYDARELAALAGIDSANTSGSLRAELYGLPNELKADLILQLDSSYYNTIKLNSLLLNATTAIKNKKLNIDAQATAHNINAAGFVIDSIIGSVNSDLKQHQLALKAANKDIQAHINSRVAVSDKIRMDIDSLGINYKNYNWLLKPDSTRIEIAQDKYAITNFELQSTGKDSIQSASLNGTFSLNADEDLKLKLRNIYLPQVYALFYNDDKLNGNLSFDVDLGGTASNPIIDANYQLNNSSYDDYSFNKFKGNFSYADNWVQTNTSLIALDSASINLQAKLPLAIRIDSMTVDTENFKNQPQWGQLSMDSVPLALAKAFYPFDQLDGVANANLTLGGTPAEPKLDGKFNLKDGLLKISNFGIDYRNINTNILFKNQSLLLDTLHMNSKKGVITGNGNVQFASKLMEAKMDNANINLGFSKFRPFDHRQFNMEVDGFVNLKANNDSTRFTGELSIPETMIYLPAVFKLMKKNTLPDIPKSLLAAQLAKDSLLYNNPEIQILDNDSLVFPKDALMLPPYLSNLQGKVKIKIPRNMWIKNDDMRLELSGDIELIKNLNFFEIFGDINVVRGQYDLLGKIFILKSGIITFEGGEEMNPRLDMEAHYNFRDTERESRTIKLLIGGNMYSPEFKFKYDDQEISEGDAISYIVFGASLSALGEIESQSSSAGDLAKMAAASLLSSQLTKLLGNTLNMDFVEYRNSSSFDNASLTVGKYLTNKLFISYEQNIGKLENDDTDRYNLRLEYEFLKYLFFELNSSSRSNGLDLIFKFDEKNNPFVKKNKK